MREKKLHFFAKSLNWEKNYKKNLLTTQQNPKSNQKRQWESNTTKKVTKYIVTVTNVIWKRTFEVNGETHGGI